MRNLTALLIILTSVLILQSCSKDSLDMDSNDQSISAVEQNESVTPLINLNEESSTVPGDYWVIVGAANFQGALVRAPKRYFSTQAQALTFATSRQKFYHYVWSSEFYKCVKFFFHSIEEVTSFGSTFWIVKYQATTSPSEFVDNPGSTSSMPFLEESGVPCACENASSNNPSYMYDDLNNPRTPENVYIPSELSNYWSLLLPVTYHLSQPSHLCF